MVGVVSGIVGVKARSTMGAVAGAAALILVFTTGCSTKNYVRSQAAPIIQNTNELDARTAADHRNITDTDQRAQAGIAKAQTAADSADQHAQAAGQLADKAQGSAKDAYNRVDSLAGVIAGLDAYKSLSETSVTFDFDKAVLTAAGKKDLDAVAASLNARKHYILELTGGTDSIGDAQYNYALSNRRADAVAAYLQSKYNIAPHKFYMVGIGKENAVATNKTAAGRKENRRVQVKVLSNFQEETATAAQNTTAGQQ